MHDDGSLTVVRPGAEIQALVASLADARPEAEFAALVYSIATEKRVRRILVVAAPGSIAEQAAVRALEDLGAGPADRLSAEGVMVCNLGMPLLSAPSAFAGPQFDLVVLYAGNPLEQLANAAFLVESGAVTAGAMMVLCIPGSGPAAHESVQTRLCDACGAIRLKFDCGATVLALTSHVEVATHV